MDPADTTGGNNDSLTTTTTTIGNIVNTNGSQLVLEHLLRIQRESSLHDTPFQPSVLLLLLLIVLVIVGNLIVLAAVLADRRLRQVTANKFIASLAVSDLLVGCVVMPLALYAKQNGDLWELGHAMCQVHLVTGVFSTTASIVHLLAICLDRYCAIIFPTEYARHSLSTSTVPYLVIIWATSLLLSSTLMMEHEPPPLSSGGEGVERMVCWIRNPQYILLSSLMSFFLPGAMIVFLYMKIFRRLRAHQLYMFGQSNKKQRAEGERRRTLPRVIIEEVRSRRGSRLSVSASGSPTRRSSGSAGGGNNNPTPPPIQTISSPTLDVVAAAAQNHQPQSVIVAPNGGGSGGGGGGDGADNNSPTQTGAQYEATEKAAKTAENSNNPKPQQRWRSPSIDIGRRRVSLIPDPSGSASGVDLSARCLHGIILEEIRRDHEKHLKREERRLEERREEERLERRRAAAAQRRASMGGAPFSMLVGRGLLGRRRRESLADTALASTSFLHHGGHALVRSKLSTVADEETLPLETKEEEQEQEQEGATEPAGVVGRRAESEPPSAPQQHPGPVAKKPKTEHLSACFLLSVPTISSTHTPPLSPLNNGGGGGGGGGSGGQNSFQTTLLKVPTFGGVPAIDASGRHASVSSHTCSSCSTDTRRISTNSCGSSLTDATDSTMEMSDSRRSSSWSALRSAVSGEVRRTLLGVGATDSSGQNAAGSSSMAAQLGRGRLRRIATQVTRAIRRKRRESLALRRESRATRLVAAILLAFMICWLPYFVLAVYRGVSLGLRLHFAPSPSLVRLHTLTSWLGYAHSCFNPFIYILLNKNFRSTLRRLAHGGSSTYSRAAAAAGLDDETSGGLAAAMTTTTSSQNAASTQPALVPLQQPRSARSVSSYALG